MNAAPNVATPSASGSRRGGSGRPPGGGEKPMTVVELAHDLDHPIDRLEVHARHGAIGDEQRLVETDDLDRRELLGRMRTPAPEPPDRSPYALR